MYTNTQQHSWRCSRCYKETLISIGDNNVCSNCGPELPNLSMITSNFSPSPHSPTFQNNDTSHHAYLPTVQLQPITHLFSSHEDSHLPLIQNNCLPPISSSPFSFSSSSLPSSLSQLPSLSAPSHSYPSSMTHQSSAHSATLPNISSLSLPLLPPRASFYSPSNPSPLPSSPSLFSSSQSNLSPPSSPLITSAFPLDNNQSLTSSSSSSTSSQSLHRVLQTVHLQHIQRLIEIQRNLHNQTQLQNSSRSTTYHPYSRSQPPYIARIINEINNVMHNHSIQHFQMLTQSLQNPRPNIDPFDPGNMPDNEMTPQEYSQFLADLFERQHHSGPPPTDKSEISKLPQIIFTEEDIKDEKQCAVCKDMFEEADTALELPCRHPFHLDCILPWLKTRNTCPCCRYQLKPEIDPDIENSDSEYEIIDSDSELSSDDESDSHYDYY